MQIIDPGGNGERVEHFWAYLVQHGPQDESLAAIKSGDSWYPLIATTDQSLATVAELAQLVANESGLPLTLARFGARTDIGSVLPR